MLLKAENLYKDYSLSPEHVVTAVDNVSFSLDKGKFVSIIGRSGSGKSTLISILAGLLRPVRGAVYLQGTDYSSLSDDALCYMRNKLIGYIPQGMCLLSNLNILDNIRLPWFLGGRLLPCVSKAEELLEQVGLAEYSRRYPYQISGGQMRRVAIARALMNSPALVIADEPTSNLDEETASDINRLLKSLCGNGTAVLIVSHEKDALKLSDEAYKMEQGKLEPFFENYETVSDNAANQ